MNLHRHYLKNRAYLIPAIAGTILIALSDVFSRISRTTLLPERIDAPELWILLSQIHPVSYVVLVSACVALALGLRRGAAAIAVAIVGILQVLYAGVVVYTISNNSAWNISTGIYLQVLGGVLLIIPVVVIWLNR